MDRLVSVVIACALGACSLSISAPAAGRRRNQLPECDSGKGLVALDSLAAIGFGVGGLAALSDEEGVGAVALVGAALFTAAALHGSGNADKCKAAMLDYSREIAELAPPSTIDYQRTPRPRRKDPEPEPVVADEDEPIEKPTPAKPAKPAEPVKPKPVPPPPPVDDWSQFWREVPQ